ncbi:MAG: hypothetical protein JOZ11_22255 [Alphaproteobacteria bacterium]|nr:hypothetical protein [Alphaproteobacteria bacterium]
MVPGPIDIRRDLVREIEGLVADPGDPCRARDRERPFQTAEQADAVGLAAEKGALHLTQ